MAASMYWYGKAFANILGGETEAESKGCDFLTNEMKVALLTSSYTPDQDTHESWADVSAYEASGSGYTPGGSVLTGKTLTYDPATNEVKLDGADPDWNPSTITARYIVLYNNSPAAAGDKILLGYMDFGENKASDNGSFKVTWHSDGILKGVVAAPA